MRELAAAISAAVNRAVHPLHVRVRNLVSRAVVKLVDDSTKMQLLQVGLLADEVREEVEHFQEYGFTSVAPDGAEGVAIFAGGSRDHGVILAVGDRRVRLKGLQKGEVAVYNREGAKVVMKANGDIEATPKSGQKFKVVGDVDVQGKITASGNIDSNGTVTGSTDCVGGGKSLKGHKHSLGLPGGTVDVKTTNAVVGSPSTAQSGAAGAVGSVSGETAAPS
jgi:phage baseplate assembly protein V